METNATIEVKSVPEIDWNAMSNLDWSAAYYLFYLAIGFWLFGILCSIVGFFCGLWIVWIVIFLVGKGIGALFINPFYCILAPLVPTVISWVLLVGFAEITQAPTRVYRKMTR